MKLYVTLRSPYARLARILVIEKALEDRVEIIQAKTRTAGSPYYQINPSGRVPYLVDDTGVGMEDSQLICAFLDGVDGKPRFHNAAYASDWAYLRLEFAARSMCDGIAGWGRPLHRGKLGHGAHPIRQSRPAGGEIAKPALAGHLDGHGKDQMRHVGRPLHQRIGCAGLKEICHALGAR